MDLNALIDSLKDCPCGKKHTIDIKALEIGSGLVHKAGEILEANGFPKKILLVADKNTLRASEGILESLEKVGYTWTLKLYDDLRVAEMDQVELLQKMEKEVDGVLSVGSGSLNDICRLSAFREDKPFAIFATAPSMDGFASDSAPITHNNFKVTYPARQPRIIIADTKILAHAPAYLKSAGFGDIIGKLIALVDWKVSLLTTGEYYCANVAAITERALDRMISLADKVTCEDEETAGAIMEALVLTGVAMQLAGTVRPASGDEHVLSHCWEVMKLSQGKPSDFHGKKVGVATILINDVYHRLAEHETIEAIEDKPDWDAVYSFYGDAFHDEIASRNNPTCTTRTTPAKLQECWPEIRRMVLEELPTQEELLDLMHKAGAATTVEEIDVDAKLHEGCFKYHPFMRDRITLFRYIPMIGIDIKL